MVCLGFKPRAAGWKAQTNPLSYGGTPNKQMLSFQNIINDVCSIEIDLLTDNKKLIKQSIHGLAGKSTLI